MMAVSVLPASMPGSSFRDSPKSLTLAFPESSIYAATIEDMDYNV